MFSWRRLNSAPRGAATSLWSDKSPASVIARAEFFGQRASAGFDIAGRTYVKLDGPIPGTFRLNPTTELAGGELLSMSLLEIEELITEYANTTMALSGATVAAFSGAGVRQGSFTISGAATPTMRAAMVKPAATVIAGASTTAFNAGLVRPGRFTISGVASAVFELAPDVRSGAFTIFGSTTLVLNGARVRQATVAMQGNSVLEMRGVNYMPDMTASEDTVALRRERREVMVPATRVAKRPFERREVALAHEDRSSVR